VQRFLIAILLFQQQGQIVVRLDVLGFDLDRLAKGLLGLVDPVQFLEHQRDVALRADEPGIGGDGALVALQRLLLAFQPAQRPSQIVQRVGVPLVHGDALAEQDLGFLILLDLELVHGVVVQVLGQATHAGAQPRRQQASGHPSQQRRKSSDHRAARPCPHRRSSPANPGTRAHLTNVESFLTDV